MGGPSPANVGGEPVEFKYIKSEDGSKELVYTLTDSLTERKRTVRIDGDSIVGVSTAPQQGRHSELVYVVSPHNPPSGIPTLEVTNAGGLPDEFVRDFAVRDFAAIRSHNDTSHGTPNIHVVISTLSGTGRAHDFFRHAVRPVLTSLMGLTEGRDYTVHTTSSASSVTSLLAETLLPRAQQGIPQSLILLSGDGGIHDTINALLSTSPSPHYTPPTIAILPTGTGNALCNSLTPTSDATLGLSALARGTPHPLPLLRVTFSRGARLLTDEATREEPLPLSDENGNPTLYAAVVCSWGLHAAIVADSDTADFRQHGTARFQIAARAALFPDDGGRPHVYRATVSVLRRGGEEGRWETLRSESDEHVYVLATLVSQLEKGFTISPASTPLDGVVRVVHFGPLEGGGEEVMRIMGLAYQGGQHVEEEAVGYEEVEGLRIEFGGMEKEGRWRRVCVDGKIMLVDAEGWVEVRREGRRAADVLCLGAHGV